jgi:hypothetical protein
MCLRLASGLSWNNPVRPRLLELAEEFDRRAQSGAERPRAEPALQNSSDR